MAMRRYGAISVLLLCAGCASLSIDVPPKITEPLAANSIIQDAVKLQHGYVDRAHDLNREATVINGIGTAAGLAALGFASFDAHPDNFKAAGLLTGAAVATSGQLTPGENARFYAQAANAVQCIVDNDSLAQSRSSERVPVAGGGSSALVSSMSAGASDVGYEALYSLLTRSLVYANTVQDPSAELKAAIASADTARTRLLTAIRDRDKRAGAVLAALARVKAAVGSRKAPDLKALLDELAAVKPPQPAPSVPDDAATRDSETQQAKANGIVDPERSGESSDEAASGALRELVGYVDRLNPEKETVALNQLTACVAAFAAS